MKNQKILSSGTAVFVAIVSLGSPVWAATIQVGASGKTFASSMVQCAAYPTTGKQSPVIQAGLFNPKRGMSATVSLNGAPVTKVTNVNAAADVWLIDGTNRVVVALSKNSDSYNFTVPANTCSLPDTSSNTFSPDGTLEYAASDKSYATVTPGCALNPKTGLAQPYVNLFDNGSYLLNVSNNGTPLTQLSALRPHTPVFLSSGMNVISAANGNLSIDYYVRNGGDGTCILP